MLDTNGQPLNKNFNQSKNITKSLMSLLGILKGLVVDKELNELELLFLETWLRSHKSLPHEGDILDLLDNIEDIVADGVVTKNELVDLETQIEDVIDYSEIAPQCVEDLTNELLGFVSGISADNIISPDEFSGLADWLKNNPDSISFWPGNILYKKIIDIMDDGVIDPEELSDLTQTCKMIAGQQFLETGAAEGMSTEFCAQPLDALPSNIKTVSFTGKFLIGSRVSLEKQAESLGIKTIKKEIPQYLNLLVIGSLASPDWRYSSHGRKIEKALINQKKGFNTLIITEENWVNLTKSDNLKNRPVSEKIEESKHLTKQILFTGFSTSEKNKLIEHANDNGFTVVTKITMNLYLLVCGSNAGPSKVNQAKKQGVSVLSEKEFYNLIK